MLKVYGDGQKHNLKMHLFIQNTHFSPSQTIDQLVSLFNDVFAQGYNTRLQPGGVEA